MFFQRKKQATRPATKRLPQRKLHTITGLLKERSIDGQFKAGNAIYHFSFNPTTVVHLKRELELTGHFTVRTAATREPARQVESVRAVFIGLQGDIGPAPVRTQARSLTAGAGNASTSEQLQEQAKATETKPQSTVGGNSQAASRSLPVAESTGMEAAVGVIYFRLSPLDARALGVTAADMSRVQLGVRLTPNDDTARNLQLLFSDLMTAIDGNQIDEQAASTHVAEINRVLKG